MTPMNEFKGKVAVITGAASGIGRGIADRCAQEGMKIVLADIEKDPLTKVEGELRAAGANVIAVTVDVSKPQDIEMLAQKTLAAYGEIHLLFNNAGISSSGSNLYESSLGDWKWFIDVNLMSVVYGVKNFVPIMLEQGTDCHIVNTASILGLTTSPGMGLYNVTKHGVVSLSETLHHELAQQNSKIKVAVLCPGFVNTRIMESCRNRPSSLIDDPDAMPPSADNNELEQHLREAVKAGLSPEEVADCIFSAIREDRFYIFTHPEGKDRVRHRMTDMLEDRVPKLL